LRRSKEGGGRKGTKERGWFSKEGKKERGFPVKLGWYIRERNPEPEN